MSTYKSLPVMDTVSLAREGGMSESVDQRVLLADNPTGLRQSDDSEIYASPSREFVALTLTRTQAETFRFFIDATYGRQLPFWIPSYQKSLVLKNSLASGASSAVVKWSGYTVNQFPSFGRRHLMFYQGGITPWYTSCTAASESTGSQQETLTIGTAGRTWTPASTSIFFLNLVRFEDDLQRLEWITRDICRCTFRVRELPQEANL